jgi:hypothetical protein
MADVPRAESARARRSRAAGAKASAAPQSSIDDFLGEGVTAAPATTAPPMPEPGGWVTGDAPPPIESFPKNGLLCSLCGKPQHETPSGAACTTEGHGGAPGVEPAPPAFSKVDAVARGGSDHTLVGADAREMQRRIDAEVAKTKQTPMRAGELDAALSSPRRSGAPDLPPAYGRIVRTTFDFDPEAVFLELDAALGFNKPLRDMGYIELAEALDDAARCYRKASRLLAHAEATQARFDADCEAVSGDMRTQAVSQLKKEKEEKGGKQITDADVTARMAALFPDEYRRQEVLKAEMKATLSHLRDEVKNWELRRREIDTMLRECRKG